MKLHLHIGLLGVIVLAWTTSSVQAQLFFTRKPRPQASQRVPELILILKTDADERKRLHAAEELREYDATTYTEIVPVLVDVLRHDKKMSVRLEALNTLSRIRPVHPLTSQAIEKAANDDEAWRVRWQAKTTVTKLHISGFATKKTDKKSPNEPPHAEPPPPPNTVFLEPRIPAPAFPPITTRPQPSDSAAPRPLPQSVNPSSPGGTPPPIRTPPPQPGELPVQGPALFP